MHKAVLPMYASEFYLYFAIIPIVIYANIGGLGGGGILIPLAMAVLHFDMRNAVPISNVQSTVSTIFRNSSNLRESHPLKRGKGTVHDYGIAILMLPGIAIGSSLGSIANLSLPGPIICAGFILCNLVTSSIGLRNFFKIRKAENNDLKLAAKKTAENLEKKPSQASSVCSKNGD